MARSLPIAGPAGAFRDSGPSIERRAAVIVVESGALGTDLIAARAFGEPSATTISRATA